MTQAAMEVVALGLLLFAVGIIFIPIALSITKVGFSLAKDSLRIGFSLAKDFLRWYWRILWYGGEE